MTVIVRAWTFAVAAGLSWSMFPGRAMALCPNCLSQRGELSPELRLVAIFLLVPFVVFLIGYRAVRRASRREALASRPSPR